MVSFENIGPLLGRQYVQTMFFEHMKQKYGWEALDESGVKLVPTDHVLHVSVDRNRHHELYHVWLLKPISEIWNAPKGTCFLIDIDADEFRASCYALEMDFGLVFSRLYGLKRNYRVYVDNAGDNCALFQIRIVLSDLVLAWAWMTKKSARVQTLQEFKQYLAQEHRPVIRLRPENLRYL